MELPADGVAGLTGERADFLVAQLLVSHEQEQESIFFRQGVERLLDALTEFLRFKNPQWTFVRTGGAFPDRFVIRAVNMPAVPGLEQVLAMF